MSNELKRKNNVPSHAELESFFVNSEKLSLIGAELKRFNPIKVMKMQGMEIRHSAILAWLLDPQETHGFQDKFLKAFLAGALSGHETDGGVTALEIIRADLRDAIIKTEWQHIDIFVSCEIYTGQRTEKWVFVIENKFYSQQYDGQLENYRKKIETLYKTADEETSVKINGIFLTLNEEPPDDTSFTSIYYENIVSLLKSLMKLNQSILTTEVSIFLKHYLNVLDEELGMSEDHKNMEQLAKELYRDHR